MSTQFTNRQWRLPNNENKDKQSNYSMDFDGSSKINCGTANTYNEFTLSAWIKKDSTAPNYAGIFGTRNSTAVQFPYLLSLDAGGYVRLIAGGTTKVLSNNPISNDTWYHVVGLGDGTNLKLYINGQLQTATATYTTQSANNDLVIGGQFDTDSSSLWVGEISNAQIWDTSLSSTEIETLYNNGSPIRTLSNIPQNSNIQGWWKLDASDTYDSSTGTWTIEDHAGSNDGTSSGMSQANLVQSDLQTVAPYSKYALDFDASSADSITINADLSSYSSITVSTWAKFVSSTGFQYVFDAGTWTGSGPAGIKLGISKKQTTNEIATYDGLTNHSTGVNVALNTWYHITVTHAGTTRKVYLNGSLIGTFTSGNLNLNAINYIGKFSLNTNFMDGSISNVSIWDTALTSAQVTEIYNEGLPSNLNSHSAYSNLVSWWQLGENSSFDGNDWIVADEKGSNNGTSTGMPVGALVNGVGTTANGVSSGMSEGNLIGDAPYSTANALSSNMAVTARVTGSGNTP